MRNKTDYKRQGEPDPAGLAGWLNILNDCGITVLNHAIALKSPRPFSAHQSFMVAGISSIASILRLERCRFTVNSCPTLLQTVGLPNHPSRQSWTNQLNGNNTTQTRADVLRALVESGEMDQKYFNEAFVVMQYFGYLGRTADAAYLDWIQTMNQNGGDYRIMINGFMNSIEYRQRFGP